MVNYENESELMDAFRKGDPAADTLLFKRSFRSMCLLAETITSELPAAEDIVAEVFIKLFNKRAEFQTAGSIRAFLYVAVRNSSYTYYNKQKRRQAAHHEIAAVQADDYETHIPAIDMEIVRAQLLEEIYQEIENLPPQCRKISKMIFLDGKTTEQIAGELQLSPQTVRTQKARAIQLLKKQLFQDGHFHVLVALSAYAAWFWDA